MVIEKEEEKMTKDEIQYWINRWSKLKPSPQRDMVIKIWSKNLKYVD